MLGVWHKNLTIHTILKKILKYTLRGLAILSGIFILLFAGVYIYVRSNKKVILEQVRHKVAEELSGNVKIGDVDVNYFATFPQVSVSLNDISITDTMFATHHHTFFTARKLYARLSVLRIIQKRDPLDGIRVDDGQLYVYTDTSGYTNSYLFSGKSKVADTSIPRKEKSIIRDIDLRNVRLIQDNQLKGKLYDLQVNRMECNIRNSDPVLYFKTKNDVLIHGIAFNTDKGSFGKETLLKSNLNFQFNKDIKQLSFKNLEVNLKGHLFIFTGTFNLGTTKTLALKISTKNIDYNFARSMLPQRISKTLSRFNADKPIDASVDITGPLIGEPLAKIQWTSGPNNVHTPFFDVTNASFSGSYINELVAGLPRNDPNSRVQFHNVRFEYQGLTFHSENVYIDNLLEPMVNCDLKTDFKLTTLNDILNIKSLKFAEGQGLLDISYSGPLQENTTKNTLINGKIVLQDGLISYRPRNIDIRNCNGNIIFKNSDVLVTDFRGSVGTNKIVMNGRANNLLSLIKTNPGKISLDWNVYSPALNLETFTSLLRKRNSVAIAPASGGVKVNKLANGIDQMLDQANIHLNLKADNLEFKKFIAHNVVASIGLFEDSYNLDNVSLQHGGGSMLITGSLRGANELYQEAKVKVNMQNVDVNKVFYAFDNFGQDAMKSDNIQGKLTTSIDVRMDIDRQLQKHPQNIEGYVDFSLKNGALINFEPIQKLQSFLFKNRNFSDIRFAELKDRLDILNRDIKINRMEIQSTALSLFVEGVYSLKGNTDISIQVPLSNLKKRNEDYKPENTGSDAKGGTSVFVRGRPGEDGNIKFKYDLFKKFRGDKKDK